MTALPLPDPAHAPLPDPGPTTRAPWAARRRVAVLRDRLLDGPPGAAYDPAQAARRAVLLRERDALLARLSALAVRLDQAPATTALDRLALDVEHHLQRRRDLAWDDVELELGGSE